MKNNFLNLPESYHSFCNVTDMCSKRRCRRNIGLIKALTIGCCLTFTGFFVVAPLIFHLSTSMQISAIFANEGPDNIAKPRKSVNFEKPENEGLPGTRNFYYISDTLKNIKLGVWHILPELLINSVPENDAQNYDKYFEKSLSNGHNIIVYLHGNTPSRATYYRVELYQILRKLNFHVITFDYRGYADSTDIDPSEDGLVTDAKAVIQYAQSLCGKSKVFVWGHSLGTGVATDAAAELCGDDECPTGVILQAAFNTLYDEIHNHPLLKIYNILPIFDWLFIEPYRKKGIKFNSEINMNEITCPILQLHAKDDSTVPFHLGQKLYQVSSEKRSKTNIGPHRFVEFSGEHLYGHNFISRAPELPEIIREFTMDAESWWERKLSLGYQKHYKKTRDA